MKKLLLLLLSVPGLLTPIFAQDNSTGEPTFLPPNAASFSKYGDIPVNYHTGTTNISVPIFEITEGNLSLPISLSYHSGGIRVDEMSSWVGLGWSLNAGGVISRSVQGGLDEGNSKSGARSDKAGWGWYRDKGAPSQIDDFASNCQYQSGTDPISGSPLTESINQTYPPNGTACYDYHYDAARGLIDSEPDIFSFNIGGYSGKFYFDELQKPVLLPVQDIQIDVTYNSNTRKFIRWKITTANGVKYYFGVNPTGTDAIENTYALTSGWPSANDNYYSTSSWYLYRIESANSRHWIELEYDSETYGFASRSSHSCQANTLGALGGTDCDDAPIPRVRNLVQGIRLSKITTSSGRYEARFKTSSNTADKRQDFSTEPGTLTAYPLKTIEIEDNYGWCKKFDLQTSYFQSPATMHSGVSYESSDQKRLKLDGIQEFACNGTISLPAYTFEYNETQIMARRYSLARDHWGYYNGADTQKGLIPNETIGMRTWFWDAYSNNYLPGVYNSVSSIGGANRNPNETKMKAWSLKKINYPTGGYANFTYEGNRHQGNLIGGLRIQKIESFDEHNNLASRKQFQYLSSELYAQPTTYGVDLQKVNPYINSNIMGYEFGVQFSSTPNTTLRSNQGYHIGYSSVQVNHEDGSHQIFTYTNSPHAYLPDYYPNNPLEYKTGNGTLRRQEDYDNTGNEVSKTNTVFDTQTFQDNETITKVAAVTGYFTYSGSPPTGFGSPITSYAWNFKNVYNISSSALRQISVTETRNSISQTTDYVYGGFHQQPLEITTTNSEGDSLKSTIKYSPDLTSPMANSLDQRNQVVPLEERKYVGGLLVSKSDYFYSGSNIMNLSHIETYPSGSNMIRTDVSFNSRDQFQSIQKEDDIPLTYYWEGDMGISLGKFTNATNGEVFYTSFEELGTGTFSTSGAKTGFRYHNGNTVNLTSLGAPALGGDLMISYHYYVNGTWHYHEKSYSSTTLSVSGATRLDEIRIYPKGALVESFQTGFGGQMISQTDAMGNTIRYEFDSLGRLKYVKDQDNYTLQENQYNYSN